jgi:hypothetical protein
MRETPKDFNTSIAEKYGSNNLKYNTNSKNFVEMGNPQERFFSSHKENENPQRLNVKLLKKICKLPIIGYLVL